MQPFWTRAPWASAMTWARLRLTESSTWVGFATIAVVLGSDPMQAHGLAQAISLIIGGGLVTVGPQAGPEDER
ncbi:hypothetical protein [Sandaracinobacter sp.]|uniref:hypothetical protein n=1 Tax=Sandaracinobacter sp. TaxID=2487581 RepID=UPI0035B22E89